MDFTVDHARQWEKRERKDIYTLIEWIKTGLLIRIKKITGH